MSDTEGTEAPRPDKDPAAAGGEGDAERGERTAAPCEDASAAPPLPPRESDARAEPPRYALPASVAMPPPKEEAGDIPAADPEPSEAPAPDLQAETAVEVAPEGAPEPAAEQEPATGSEPTVEAAPEPEPAPPPEPERSSAAEPEGSPETEGPLPEAASEPEPSAVIEMPGSEPAAAPEGLEPRTEAALPAGDVTAESPPIADVAVEASPDASEPAGALDVATPSGEERDATPDPEPVQFFPPPSPYKRDPAPTSSRPLEPTHAQDEPPRPHLERRFGSPGSAAGSIPFGALAERIAGTAGADARSLPAEVHWPSVIRTALRYLAYLFLAWLTFVLALIVIYRFVNPPFSNLMLAERLGGGEVRQIWVPINRVSRNLVRAVVMSEDARFCHHWGVDLRELGAAIMNSRDGTPRGASTITMQVAKNLFLWNAKSYVRKALEMPLTFAIELAWPKRRILEVYLNIAEWAPGVFGAEAAARYHFNKSAQRITEREAALMAVALPNPLIRDASSPGPGTRRLATRILLRTRAAGRSITCI